MISRPDQYTQISQYTFSYNKEILCLNNRNVLMSLTLMTLALMTLGHMIHALMVHGLMINARMNHTHMTHFPMIPAHMIHAPMTNNVIMTNVLKMNTITPSLVDHNRHYLNQGLNIRFSILYPPVKFHWNQIDITIEIVIHIK